MFIQTEQTPNPATIKFIPGQVVLAQGSAEFKDASDTLRSPLAARLFRIDGVASVFFASDFVSVTRNRDGDWSFLKPQILAAIMEHYLSGLPVIEGPAGTIDNGIESELILQIRELLDTRVRPAVARDGGDIDFVKFEDGVVWLHMKGACAGCPSATATLKLGIENMLKHYVPEVKSVEQYQS